MRSATNSAVTKNRIATANVVHRARRRTFQSVEKLFITICAESFLEQECKVSLACSASPRHHFLRSIAKLKSKITCVFVTTPLQIAQFQKFPTLFCVFLLTDFSARSHTAVPDSGDVEAPGRTGSRMYSTSPHGPRNQPGLLTQKNRARAQLRARMRSVKRCCDGCVISPANGRALPSHRSSTPSTAQSRSNFLLCSPHAPVGSGSKT